MIYSYKICVIDFDFFFNAMKDDGRWFLEKSTNFISFYFKDVRWDDQTNLVFATTTEFDNKNDLFFLENYGIKFESVSRNYIIEKKIADDLTKHLNETILSGLKESFCDKVYATLMDYRDEQ